MKHLLRSLLLSLCMLSLSIAQIKILDDFEISTGHFNKNLALSPATHGVRDLLPELDSTTAVKGGNKSLKIVLIDGWDGGDWIVRLLSGVGDPANNINMEPKGWVGYWLKTDRPWLRTAIMIDAPSTGEVGDTADVIGDGLWHLYQWNLGVDSLPEWTGWVNGDGNISDDPFPTLDAIWFFAPDGSDTTIIYLDYVAWNPDGELLVPVELISFSASVQKNVVDLRWVTSTEINNRGFEIERRTEESNYYTVAFVQGKGNSTEISGYTYSDEINQPGVYFYRLKQLDYNGTFEYSKEVMVNVLALPDQYALAQNYPNPFNPSTKIVYQLPVASEVSLRIYNVIGKEVTTLVNEEKESGFYEVNWNAANLSSGVYYYQLKAGEFVQLKKMILMK